MRFYWIITVLLIIILVFVIIYLWVKYHQSYDTKIISPLVWSKPEPGPDKDKNTCQLYQFPSVITTINNKKIVIPGTPTFDNNILNQLEGKKDLPKCIDTDQIIAQQVQHTCIEPQGVINSIFTRCFLMSGGTTGINGKEIYYTDTQCPKIPLCYGQIGVVSVNFQAPIQPDIFCLQKGNTGDNLTMAPCDPSNEKQLFRITRISPGQKIGTIGQSQNGLLAQILDRDTGLCVLPGNSTTSTIYNPDYLRKVDDDCGGNTTTIYGTNIILDSCTKVKNNGFVWALLPSLPFCSLTQGCPGCTGCIGECYRNPYSNLCTCPNNHELCTGGEFMFTPQQIVYVGDLDMKNIPQEYKGLKGSSAIIQWLKDNNAKAMFYGGTGSGVILKEIGIDVQQCDQKPYTAQYLDLTLYNLLINRQVCLGTIDSNCLF